MGALIKSRGTYVPLLKLQNELRLHVAFFPVLGIDSVDAFSATFSSVVLAGEAAVTAELFNSKVTRLNDVGVAGLHRLLSVRDQLTQADVVIVCAGMEGALPSVVGGLVGVPVIAVPTSVGYGASFDGAAALLGMLNSCSPNVTVVNIDNGFGAAYTAVLIARASVRRS